LTRRDKALHNVSYKRASFYGLSRFSIQQTFGERDFRYGTPFSPRSLTDFLTCIFAILNLGRDDIPKEKNMFFNGSLLPVVRFMVTLLLLGGMLGSVQSKSVLAALQDPMPGEIARVSVNSNGEEAQGYSSTASISADGRYVAFQSGAANLVPGDTNLKNDIFVRDVQTGTTTRVSVASNGAQANGHSTIASISGDGRYIAFDSEARNLVSGDTNGASDIFVHDMQTKTTTRLSVNSSGGQANRASSNPVISEDGSLVAFVSSATNLVPEDTHGESNIFVHNLQTGITSLASIGPNGAAANSSYFLDVSADGRYVAFYSNASNLVPDDTNERSDIFVKDLQSSILTRVSVDSDGTQANGHSTVVSISADGRYVAFDSEATNLVSGDTNEYTDVFLHDRQTGITTRVSVDSSGAQMDVTSQFPSISGDGRFIAFQLEAPSDDILIATIDVFVHDTQTGSTRRVSVGMDEQPANGFSSFPVISADGQSIAFQSSATNLVPGDTSIIDDIFLYRQEIEPPSETTFYLSLTSGQTLGGISAADEDILSFDGTQWSLYFDSSDVGVKTPDLVAFAILDADTLLLSFSSAFTINGVAATPQDVLRFEAASLGSDTAGSFSLYFDGSDVGLTTTTEEIDALSILPDGHLLISTTGNPSIPGLTGGRDEDVLAFTPTSLGEATSGTWSLYFDGSDVGLEATGEDVDALDVAGDHVYLSTRGDFAVNGLSGFDEDVFVCTVYSLGEVTACDYSSSLFFDGSSWELTGNDVDAFNIRAAGNAP
jgi:Tol biopolymer transport system component